MKYTIITLLFCMLYVTPFSIAQKDEPKKDQNLKTQQKIIPKPGKLLFGIASYYADGFAGRKTANGQSYGHDKFTAACNVLPLGTWVRVTNIKNKRRVVVHINDRLHPKNKRVIDLSYAAAEKLGYITSGITQVEVVVLDAKKLNE